MVYLGKRQGYSSDDGYSNDGNWWYSDTAEAIKWAVVAAIFFGILLFFLLGYLHAKRRIRKGQQPLAYHRWLLPRSQRIRYAPQQFSFYHHQQAPYEMQPYPPPPPAYHHNEMPPPPQYEPPQGASKLNPNQQYTAPPGPPPAGESSRSGPPSPVSPIQERRQSLREQFTAGQPPHQEAELPPRAQTSSRSWNPLKRFK
ncbi:MAG: hypothetical protein L6R39_005148 [Caloplaca ligustica]|nr:MAG: hypothetical protein L6R39_005148 [Caloplaca ligustica]